MPVALVVYVLAWVCMLVLGFGVVYNGTSTGLAALFSLFPWTLLSKGLLDLAEATTGAFAFGQRTRLLRVLDRSRAGRAARASHAARAGTNPGISWAQRGSYCFVDPPSLQQQASARSAAASIPDDEPAHSESRARAARSPCALHAGRAALLEVRLLNAHLPGPRRAHHPGDRSPRRTRLARCLPTRLNVHSSGVVSLPAP